MTALLAGLPILAILVLMLGFRWSAGRAGLAGVAVAVAVAVRVFEFPGALAPDPGLGLALWGTGAEAGFTALTILWIIGPALGIYELQLRTGNVEVLRAALASFAPDPRILALLVAWFFALFMEGAAGFGASVALAAPFLAAAGFPPVQAVTVALVGHAVGVSFGAIGTPVVPQVAATGLSGLEIARATGIHHSLLGWIPLVVIVAMVTRSGPGVQRGPASTVRKQARRIWGWAAAAFVCFIVPYTLFWAWVGPELPTVGGALVGGGLFVALLWRFGSGAGKGVGPHGEYRGRGVPTIHPATGPAGAGALSRRARAGLGGWGPEEGAGSLPGARTAERPAETPGGAAVARAAAPYLVLVALVLLTRLVPPVREALLKVQFEWELAGFFGGSFQPFYHPGTLLLLGFAAGALLQGAGGKPVLGAVVAATRRLVPVAGALVAMLVISRMMVHAGMTEALAKSASSAAGGIWPLLSPAVGTLGTFVTGSATASNILFTDFQRDAALALDLSVVGALGAQGFGAAAGNIVCPHNVVAAGATVGLQGREGEILRRTLWVTLVYTAAGGILGLWLGA